jgi:hypothetical protein
MKFDERLCIIFIVGLALISCAGAISSSISGGSSVVSTVNGGYASGITEANSNGVASQASFTSSDVNYNHWLADTTGKEVRELLNIVQGTGNYAFQFKKGNTLVQPDKKVGYSSSLSSSQQLSVTSAKIIDASVYARNGEGDIASLGIKMGDGTQDCSLLGYQDSATSTRTQATAVMSLDSATGSLDLKSHAQDKRRASEYLSYSNGKTVSYRINYGAADFEYKSNSLGATQLQSTATSKNVVITTPKLSSDIKTAIMLEPFNYVFTKYAGATDLGTTVFPDLVSKGYATLRYTDAGASIDKFQNLGQYDVALINSHMASNSIGLSTTGGTLPSYTTSKNSMVILAGCDSFDGYPTKSALANWISGASLSGGYEDSVGTNWNNDYLSYFFDGLSQGDSAGSANAYAKDTAEDKYGTGTYNIPLVFYGDENYQL